MPDLFDSILAEGTQTTLTVGKFLICVGISLLAGLIYCLASSLFARESRSLRLSLFFLPAVICVTVMMVNGNLGIGVAVAGAFSLVRFRSAPGSAKEMAVIFMTMCTGLITGVGYIAYALLFTIIMCAVLILAQLVSVKRSNTDRRRILKITVPEDLDYEGIFDDIFDGYTSSHTLVGVKTSNMGSLYRLTYELTLKDAKSAKAFIDSLRVRNGNLEISLLRHADTEDGI